jgi:hypothetical protein
MKIVIPIVKVGIFINDGVAEFIPHNNYWRLLLFWPPAFALFTNWFDMDFNTFKRYWFNIYPPIKTRRKK